MAELFGFRIERSKGNDGVVEPSFTPPSPDDGTIDVAGGGFWGQVQTLTEEKDLILT